MNVKELRAIIDVLPDNASVAISAPRNPAARRLWESNVVHHRFIADAEGKNSVIVLYCYDPQYTTDF